MKAGLATSVMLHAAVLGFGLVSLSAPRAFEVADVEALPIDIVPIESITQIQQGDRQAPMAEKPAPKPTQRPDIVPEAQKVGENDVDTENPVTPEPKPRPVQTAEAVAPAPMPKEKPKLEETPKPKEEPKPTPATEVAPEPAPKQDVKPEPVKQAALEPEPAPKAAPKAAEAPAEEQPKPAEESVQLPDTAPAPEAKPRPAQAQTAKTPDRKNSEKPVKEASSKPKSEDTGSIEDQVAALLNKEKASGGGARRSTQQAALGGEKTSGGKLSKGEEDAFLAQLRQCWLIPAGIENGQDLRASVRFKVDAAGKLDGRPVLEASSGNGTFDSSAVRAVQICDRQGFDLPVDKADIWSEIVINFSPSDMYF